MRFSLSWNQTLQRRDLSWGKSRGKRMVNHMRSLRGRSTNTGWERNFFFPSESMTHQPETWRPPWQLTLSKSKSSGQLKFKSELKETRMVKRKPFFKWFGSIKSTLIFFIFSKVYTTHLHTQGNSKQTSLDRNIIVDKLTRAFPLVAIRCVPTMPKFGRFLTLNQICRR